MSGRIVAPKREKLFAALASLKQKEDALAEAMRQFQKLQEKLEKLQEMYDAKMREKEELIKLASVQSPLANRKRSTSEASRARERGLRGRLLLPFARRGGGFAKDRLRAVQFYLHKLTLRLPRKVSFARCL